jgi:hypothetical protein
VFGVQLRAAAEEAEKAVKKKNKAEEHMYTLIKLATEEDIRDQIGRTTYFDLVNYDTIKVHRIKKQTLFQDFKVPPARHGLLTTAHSGLRCQRQLRRLAALLLRTQGQPLSSKCSYLEG